MCIHMNKPIIHIKPTTTTINTHTHTHTHKEAYSNKAGSPCRFSSSSSPTRPPW